MHRSMLLAISFLVVIYSCAKSDVKPDHDETEAVNRKNLEIFIDRGWNEKDLSVIDSVFANSFTRRVNGVNLATNKNELAANLQVYFSGFPDLKIKLDDTVSAENQVYIHWTLTGTHTGVYGELPPTGKRIKISGISRVNFDQNGKIVHEEVFYNELSLLQQMGHTLNPPVLE